MLARRHKCANWAPAMYGRQFLFELFSTALKLSESFIFYLFHQIYWGTLNSKSHRLILTHGKNVSLPIIAIPHVVWSRGSVVLRTTFNTLGIVWERGSCLINVQNILVVGSSTLNYEKRLFFAINLLWKTFSTSSCFEINGGSPEV